MQRGGLAGSQDFFGDEIPVDRHAKRLADARIEQRLAGREVGRLRSLDVAVHPDEDGRQERIEAQLRGLLFA